MILAANSSHLEAWARMRAALWPASPPASHRAELEQMLAEPSDRHIAFMALNGEGEPVGFVEASLRFDYVNGCDTSPVAFIEGVYVRPDRRRGRIARALCEAVESWGAGAGCREMASDALITNTVSHAFHAAVGFEETERVVFFHKALQTPTANAEPAKR